MPLSWFIAAERFQAERVARRSAKGGYPFGEIPEISPTRRQSCCLRRRVAEKLLYFDSVRGGEER
jgi:hypothetical protein